MSKLTLKQRKWIKEYIDTGNATEAAMRVYDCKDKESAGTIGSENLQKLAMADLMESMGLTDVALINVGTEGMTKAKKIHGTGDNFVETPDYATRHKYWDTMLKLKGKMTDKTGDVRIGQVGGEMSIKFIADERSTKQVAAKSSKRQTQV